MYEFSEKGAKTVFSLPGGGWDGMGKQLFWDYDLEERSSFETTSFLQP